MKNNRPQAKRPVYSWEYPGDVCRNQEGYCLSGIPGSASAYRTFPLIHHPRLPSPLSTSSLVQSS